MTTAAILTNLPSPLDFFSRLKWIDGRPLLETIEPYRRKLFLDALYTFRADGSVDFARYSISASSDGSTQMPTVGDFLGIGLRFPDERLEPRPQILG
jgi:hypothetical protein